MRMFRSEVLFLVLCRYSRQELFIVPPTDSSFLSVRLRLVRYLIELFRRLVLLPCVLRLGGGVCCVMYVCMCMCMCMCEL